VQRYLNRGACRKFCSIPAPPNGISRRKNKWTTSGLPLYPTEGRILARYVMSQKPTAKIAILYQNGEFGKDYTNAFKAALTEMGSKVTIVGEEAYELTDPTIDSQLINLSRSGADVFFNVTTGRATSQSIRKLAEIGWRPLHIVVSTSVGLSILNAAGVQNATGIVSTQYAKEPGSLRWKDDPDVKAFQALRRKRFPNIDPDNTIAFLGCSQAATIVHVLEQCGDDLTRENVLAKATALKGYRAPSFMPRISYSTTPTDYTPIRELFVGVFNGKDWDLSDTPVAE
jgi:ABC-type branched-subunit amino acid transport system substrate-binding protein